MIPVIKKMQDKNLHLLFLRASITLTKQIIDIPLLIATQKSEVLSK